jgi:vancomycin resistance protein YoaR
VSAPLEDVRAPAVTETDLDTALATVERATSAAVVLSNPSPADELVLEPVELAQVLTVEQDLGAEEGARLRVTIDHDALRDRIEDEGIDRFRAEPVEASFSVVDGELVVEGGTVGFEPDPDPIPELVVELATAEDGERQAQLPGEVLEPQLSEQRAEELGIVEQVSSFTTPLVPGQPRNTNLQRAAEVLNGSVILPGERFSLDDTLGPRSRERGFVENGYIRDGEMVSVVGGGVSQMATTFLNAAWFAGIELVDFQPHSLYFSRYPMGREATMARRLIDLVVENDSPYGILIISEADDRELTVSFWSTSWAEVDSHTGEPYNRRRGELRDGFTVDVTRTVTYPDGSSQTETYTHTYSPEDQPR